MHPQRVEILSHAQREHPSNEIQWTCIDELDFVPHPCLAHPEFIKIDRMISSNPLALYGVENAKLAPGYRAPKGRT